VTNSGHADLVQMKDGSWWAVFLASRPYQGFLYNTGRETFLLPVSWKDGWPVILEPGKAIPYVVKGPKVMKRDAQEQADLVRRQLRPARRVRHGRAGDTSGCRCTCRSSAGTSSPTAPCDAPAGGATGRETQCLVLRAATAHQRFAATTELHAPKSPGTAAGLAAYQNERYWYFFGARRVAGKLQLFLERRAGEARESVTTAMVDAPETLRLLINGNGGRYSFFYDAGDGWQMLRDNDDASILSTEIAGGFVGTVLGPYARQE
jgi:alpha-N-arabinofuranosidase